MARMRVIGSSFDKGYRDDLNYNFGLLEALIGEANGLTNNLREEMLGKINNLQQQIDMLTGENIGELLERLNDSIQQALTAAQEARTAKTATEEATALAKAATELANASALLAEEKANYANEKAVLAQEAADNANQEASTLSQLKIDVVQATQDANTATGNANQATQAAQTATDAINIVLPNVTGLINLKEWSIETQYKKNNFVTLEGNGYMALRDNKGVKPPSFPVLSNADWAMFVQKGEKGEQGTGVRILGTLPDESSLPPIGEPGDAYLINGDLYVWSDTTNDWTNVGTIKGPKGDTGPQGPQGEQGPPGQDADLTEVNQEIANIQQTVTDNKTEVTEHLGQDVLSENGVHGIRYFNGELSVKNGESPWEVVETGGSLAIQDYSTGHLDDLKETGTYYSSNSPVSRGFPQNIPTSESMITVYKLSDTAIYQQVTFVTNYQTSSPRSVSRIYDTAWRQWTFLPMAITQDVNSISNFGSTAIAPSTSVLYDLFFGYPQTPSLNSGWKVQAANSIRYVKLGNIVHINGTISGNASPPPSLMFTLPVDYRPTRGSIYFSAGTPSRSPNTLTKAEILNTGDVILEATSNININSLVHLNVSFYIG